MTLVQMWSCVFALAMMACDILTGFIAACINHNVDSSKMRIGLLHKTLIICLIAVSWFVEFFSLRAGMNLDIPICTTVCFYVVIMELSSVLENIGKGYPEFAETKLYSLFRNSKDLTDNRNGE